MTTNLNANTRDTDKLLNSLLDGLCAVYLKIWPNILQQNTNFSSCV